MRGIGKSFGGIPVLSNVDLLAAPGEVIALLGSNGAGKSTLVKILTGVYARDAGEVRIDGEEVRFKDARAAVASGVRLLPQEISVMPDMTVAENISLADLPLRPGPGFRVVDDSAMRERARTLLEQLGFGAIEPDRLVHTLSVAERRIVEIARALAGRASILVMDEPTAALTENEAKLIFRIIRRLKEQSVSVIYISHYLNEVFEISDRIAVLRDGLNAGLFDTPQRLDARADEAENPDDFAAPDRERYVVKAPGDGERLDGESRFPRSATGPSDFVDILGDAAEHCRKNRAARRRRRRARPSFRRAGAADPDDRHLPCSLGHSRPHALWPLRLRHRREY
jgi:ABC-type multidrug transport system ATPase subunit